MKSKLRARQVLGKYKVNRRLATGGFADVYDATDTVEGVRVALKVPHGDLIGSELLQDFRREVRMVARLDHPNVLSIKSAGFVDGRFVIASPLGEQSLADRLKSRLSLRKALSFAEQLLEGLAHAHRQRIIHLDIKPENLILFSEDRLRLADFGIAKVAQRTLSASGSGTLGYMAPEQAMGKPSFHSDVFSVGLVLYRMFSGALPEWPYEWPLRAHEKLRSRLPPKAIEFLRRALQIDPTRRYDSGPQMLRAFRRIKPGVLRHLSGAGNRKSSARAGRDWREMRRRQFLKRFGRVLEARGACPRCREPVGETMAVCPWCGERISKYRSKSEFPRRCPRCQRGVKADWRFCPWCYGASIGPSTPRSYSDARYRARCANPVCSRKLLMPFMRYCPWCRRKVRRAWTFEGAENRCRGCGSGVVSSYWRFCPWCSRDLEARKR